MIIMNGPSDCIRYLQNVIFKDLIDEDTTQSPSEEYNSTSLPVNLDARAELFHKVCDFATKSLIDTLANLTSISDENDTLNWPEDDDTTNCTSRYQFSLPFAFKYL